MNFYADLHIHSKYAYAVSRYSTFETLSFWAQKKGISLLATSDFTHPKWFDEIRDKLTPADGSGLFRLKREIEGDIQKTLPDSCRNPVFFKLCVEVSTVYAKRSKTRKIHHLIYARTLEQAGKLNRRFLKHGDLEEDGRPTLNLSSRDLLEMVLDAGEDCYVIPAHIWTPWFGVLGSRTGFDSIQDCYEDLAGHVFAVETGLSADPEMCWRVKSLDPYRLVSFSDAHSPQKLGREVTVLEAGMDYDSIVKAFKTGEGFKGTLEFFPEEGKYHLDGHRNCGTSFLPAESRKIKKICPVCRRKLTIGVLHRVEDLAGREEGQKPKQAFPFRRFIPLNEILAEIEGVSVASKKVQARYEDVLARLGPEIPLLVDKPVREIEAVHPNLAAAIGRMRSGHVIKQAGYDGQFGVMRLFTDAELEALQGTKAAKPKRAAKGQQPKRRGGAVQEARA